MRRRRSLPQKETSTTTILLIIALICVAGFAGYYFGILKRTRLTGIELSHQLPMELEKSRQLTAIGKFSDNSSRDITNALTWTSSDTGVAAVSNMQGTRGLVHSKNAGQTVITAKDQHSGIVGTTVIKVSEAQLVSIELSPSDPVVTLGQKQQITAVGTFSDGKKKDITKGITWGSSANSVAYMENPIESPGLAVSKAAGATIITAKDPQTNITGTTSLTVSEAKLTAYALSPENPTVSLGTNISITATGSFSDGSTREITTDLLWASSNQSVAQLDESTAGKGVVHTRSKGSAVITATDPETGLTSSITVTVTSARIVSLSILQKNPTIPMGKTLQFTVRSKYTDGTSHVLQNSVVWASSDPGVAEFQLVKNQRGLIQPKATGTTRITVRDTKSDVSDTTVLTVVPARLVSYEISPRYPSLALGKKQQLAVNGVFTDQSKKDMTQDATWSVADPSIAKISNAPLQKGVITSLAPGSTAIYVKDEKTGVRANAPLIVTAAELVTMTIAPEHTVIPLGQNRQLHATGTFSDGTTADITKNISWVSSNLSVAMVGNTPEQKGNVFSKSTGVSVITTKDPASGVRGTARITVSGKELVSINIEADRLEMPMGTTMELKANGLFSDGSREDITESGDWNSETPAVIAVLNKAGKKGKVTAVAMGMTSVSFAEPTSGSRKTISLSVTSPKLKSIQINPASPVIYLGDLQQFKAIGIYTDGTQKDITEAVEWSSSNPTLTSIRNNLGRKGLATALAVGSSVITALHPETKINGKANFTGKVNW